MTSPDPLPGTLDWRRAEAALLTWYGRPGVPRDPGDRAAILSAITEPTDTEAVLAWNGDRSPSDSDIAAMKRARQAAAEVR